MKDDANVSRLRAGKPVLPENPNLQDNGLRLTALRTEEINLLLALFNEPQAAGFYIPTMVRPYNVEQLQHMLRDWNDRAESFVFAIRQAEQLIGIVNIDGLSWVHSHAEIGIALASPAVRGQGYAAAALRLFLHYLFVDIGLRRVFCRIMDGNEASVRLFARAGFREEGRLRQHVYRSGQYLDMLFFGLLASEWKNHKER